ncbi:autotransporter assembly complex protein TamA [Pseudovibrio exalbescens]|uniref:autotransporter assembly complex protein TamA n=1 Tax=Pseudovibrio exalbescens TaxID=197461 RepID=UPI002366D154|nr:autotransporter assembly complex family protein [Pseudovibrio exalbescens]MDD7909039.1 autotransporter assembly complex protein TamA [Pseudovibrio exalbescens]
MLKRLGVITCVVAALAMPASSAAEAFSLFGFHLWGEKEPEANLADAIPEPTDFAVTLELSPDPATGEVNTDLKSALETNSELFSKQDTPVSGEAGVLALAASDFERLVGTLYTQGYYGGVVTILVDGRPVDAVIEDPTPISARPIPVDITVTAGPEFTLGTVDIHYNVARDATLGQLPTAEALGLQQGAPAFSEKVLTAETRGLRAFEDLGYPKAAVKARRLTANHQTSTLDVTLVFDGGRLAKFGPVTVSGAERVDPEFIRTYANIPEGERYDAKILKRAETRLRDLEVFASLRVQPGETIAPDGTLPINITVSERPRRVFGFGANWSSNEGFGVEGYWRHRNLFGQAEKLQLSGSVGQIDAVDPEDLEYALRLAFEKPGAFGPTTAFTTSVAAVQERPDNYRSRSISADAFFVKEFDEKLSARVGGELYFANEEDVFGNNNYFLVGIPGYVTYDSRNNEFNPSSGIFAEGFIEPAIDALDSSPLLFSRFTVATYKSLDEAERFILAGRLGTGAIYSDSVEDVPASRRFFLGGGGSVRGYAYKNIGPREGDEVIGGRSYLFLNGELRTKITDTIGLVGFVDAGAAYDTSLPDFSEPLQVGVGAGLRYFTPVGPLRLDVGVPLDPKNNDPSFAIYVGLSQSF